MFTLRLTPVLEAAVKEYQEKYGYTTKAAAITALILSGLAADKQ